MAERDDRELATEARAGSLAAFDELLARHHRSVVGLALRITGDLDEAHDVAQDTFFAAYRNLDRFDPERPFAPWLCAIARNSALDALRRRRRRRLGVAAAELAYVHATGGIEDDIVRRDDAVDVRAAVAELPVRYRDALELYYVDDLRYREVAVALEIPLGTVKTFLARGKRLLRTRLSEPNGRAA